MTILGECAASSAPAAGRRRRVSVCQNSTPVSFSRHQSPLLLHGRGARLGARSCGLNLALRKSRTGNLKQWGSPRRQHPGPLHRAPPPRHSWRYHPLSWDNGLRHPHPSGPARSGPSDAHFLCDPGQGRAPPDDLQTRHRWFCCWSRVCGRPRWCECWSGFDSLQAVGDGRTGGTRRRDRPAVPPLSPLETNGGGGAAGTEVWVYVRSTGCFSSANFVADGFRRESVKGECL